MTPRIDFPKNPAPAPTPAPVQPSSFNLRPTTVAEPPKYVFVSVLFFVIVIILRIPRTSLLKPRPLAEAADRPPSRGYILIFPGILTEVSADFPSVSLLN